MEMLFLICCQHLNYQLLQINTCKQAFSLYLCQILSVKQRLYCCLLFFINFFQYVKELFNPRDKYCYLFPIYMPFISSMGDGGE